MSIDRLRPLLALLFASIIWSCSAARAWAQACPGDSTEYVNGTISVSGGMDAIQVNLEPCQTVLFDVTTTGNTMYGASVYLSGWNREPSPNQRELFAYSWPSYGTVSKPGLPTPGPAKPWVPPYRGTRGVEGLIKEVRISATFIFGPLTYTITITKVARPGYNTGGTDFSNATPITMGTPQSGSLHDWEPGQFYAIELQPQQTIYAQGHAEASPSYGSNFYVELYDENQIYQTALVNGIATYGVTYFPGTNMPAMFTHTAAYPATYYLRLWTRWYPTHDFQFTIEAPKLKLFLDADEPRNFNPNAPEDDISTYLPGTYQRDDPSAQPPHVKWVSKPVPTGITPIERVEVIAAYVVGEDHIVDPPAGGDVTFTLYDPNDPMQESTVSRFVGIAMNHNDPRGNTPSLPDFEFLGGPSVTTVSVPFSIWDKTARVELNVWDYGGFATVFARRGSGPGPAAAFMKLPKDGDNNLIPDAGWHVFDSLGQDVGQVGDAGAPPSDDADSLPPGNGMVGDGLSKFEEYRGFVALGKHGRTDPVTKDVFVYSGFAAEGLGDAWLLPLRWHEMYSTEFGSTRLIAPNHRNEGWGGDAPGHFTGYSPNGWSSEQRVVAVVPNEAVTTITSGFGATDSKVSPEGGPWTVDSGSAVFLKVIRFLSPTHDSYTVDDSNVDGPKIMGTIAHEIGHNVGLRDQPKMPNYSCPPPADTVMVTLYFPTKNPKNKPSCAWNNIPRSFNSIDLDRIRVR